MTCRNSSRWPTVLAVCAATLLSWRTPAFAAERENILICQAHPDDLEGCLGFAIRAKDRFKLHIATFTGGESGIRGKSGEETRAIRRAEDEAVARELGAELHEIGQIDGAACATQEAVDRLAALLRELKPRAVFVHFPIDLHYDHAMCYAATWKAYLRAKPRPEIYFFEEGGIGQTHNFHPQHYVDISGVWEEKKRLMRLWKSQNAKDSLVTCKTPESLFRGAQMVPPVKYAEAYEGLIGLPAAGPTVFRELPPAPVAGRAFEILSDGVPALFHPFVRTNETFRDMACVYTPKKIVTPEGAWTYDLDAPVRTNGPDYPMDRFFFNVYPRNCLAPHQFYEGTFAHDRARYADWKARHPGFRGFMTFEMGNDAYMPWRKPQSLVKGRKGREPVSEAKARELTARPLPATREGYVEEVIRPYFNRAVEWCYGDPRDLTNVEGGECLNHLLAYWGAGGVGIETTRDYFFYQVIMTFTRGAARQFEIPWHWYIASYLSGEKGDSTFFAEPDLRGRRQGPNYGISQSAVKRATHLAWLSGAASYAREAMDMTHFLQRAKPPALSGEGEMFAEFRALTRRQDRGEPYQPLALLVPACRGYTRLCGKAFKVYDYTHDDFALDAWMSTLLDFPENRLATNEAARIERVMANSPYGDVFDVLTPDFPKGDAFRRAIKNYRTAIFAGAPARREEMVRTLRDWVTAGGTLVLTAAQLKPDDAAFAGIRLAGTVRVGDSTYAKVETDGAEVIRRTNAGLPVFTQHRVGRGRVIVATEEWYTPWYGESKEGQARALEATALGTPRRFADLEWLTEYLERDLLPIRVKGFVQYGFNRLPDGWLVYLVNNAGVVKFYDKPQQIAPGGTEVTLDLTPCGGVAVRDLCAERTVAVADGRVRVTVPNGDVVILKVQTSRPASGVL